MYIQLKYVYRALEAIQKTCSRVLSGLKNLIHTC